MAHSTPPEVRPSMLVVVLAFTGIVSAITLTMVIPLIAELPTLLNTTASNASWAITATLLAGAVATPVTGRLGDLYGKRKMMLICTVPLIAGAVLCAVSSSLLPMIIGRGLQGIGAGMIPLGISAMRDLLPPDKLHSAIALMSSSMGIGAALGLPLAAVVAENTTWRVLFWASAALSVVIFILIWFLVPATPVLAGDASFDVVGAVGLGIGLVSLLLSISKGADWGWTSGITLGLFATAFVVLFAWAWFELRSDAPLVDLRLAARPQVLLTNAASMVIGFSMFAQSLIIPQLLQLPTSTGFGLGQSMLAMGLWIAPGGFVMMLSSQAGAHLSTVRGPKSTLLVGSLILALGYGSSIMLMGSLWGLMVVVCICNAGIGFAYGSMPALIMGAVPTSATASANSLNTLMRSIGTSGSAAVVGVILAQMSVEVAGQTLPTEAGFRTGLLIGCGAALLAAAIVVFIPAPKMDRPKKSTATRLSTARV